MSYIISSRSASLKHGQRMRLLPMTQIPNSGRTRLKAAGSQAHRSSGSEISGHHLHRGDRQKFSRGPGVPCTDKKVHCRVLSGSCTRFRSPTTFPLPAPGARKRWYLRSWTTRTFRIDFSRSMASFFLVPLAQRCIPHQNIRSDSCVSH